MLSWFPVDIHVRNDPKIRAMRQTHGPAGLGYLVALWSYVATEGSQTDPGVGLDSAGRPLNLTVLAGDLDFPTVDACRDFLSYLASIGLIDADAWTSAATIILPAMRKRLAHYRKTKGRTPTGRPPGRPRKSGIQKPETLENNHASLDGFSAKTLQNSETQTVEIDKIPNEINPDETPGNCGETPGNSGNSYSVLSCTLPDLQLESEDPDQGDPRVGKLTPKKLVRLWNEVRAPGPKVLGVGPARYERFRIAISRHPDVREWEQAILYLNGVRWANACGEGAHANFRADLDYLAKPGNLTKALERLAAQNLPTAKPARHTGRVEPKAGKYRAVIDAQKAEDAAVRGKELKS